jgi:hypothetical protein
MLGNRINEGVLEVMNMESIRSFIIYPANMIIEGIGNDRNSIADIPGKRHIPFPIG